jgi:signal transduction histidine kinase
VPALERLVEGIRERSGISIDFEAGLLTERLPSEAETALYRIVQEALTNILKHAEARHISVSLARKPGSVTAVIEDDGRGFDPARRVEGLGLLGMRERIALIGGRVAVESRPGAGTTIAVEVPLP